MHAASVKTPSSSPLASVVKGVAATVVLGLCVAVFPLVPVVLIPFVALPAAHVCARWGTRMGAVVAVAAGVLIYVGLGIGAAVLIFLLAMGLGTIIGSALRRGWRFAGTFGFATMGTFFVFVLWSLLVWLVLDADLAGLKDMVHAAINDAAAAYRQAGLSEASAEGVAQQLRALVGVIPYLAPGLAGMGSILLAACTLGLVYKIFPRLRLRVPVNWTFARFRMHWASAYVSIVGLAMLLFSGGEAAWRDYLMYAGINLLLVSQTLFFIQGLAAVRWFVLSRQLQQGSATALYILAILGQVLLQLTGLLGLFDTWIDYRKRFAVQSPRTGLHG